MNSSIRVIVFTHLLHTTRLLVTRNRSFPVRQ
jgi:hypothetical protein